MKHIVRKVSTWAAVLGATAFNPAFADVDGEIVELSDADGSVTIRVESGEPVNVGEEVTAFQLAGDFAREVAKGTVQAISEGNFVAVFTEGEGNVEVGMLARVFQPAPETQADVLASIPGDKYSVTDGVEVAAVDAPAAIKACREALKEHPKEPRFYAQLGRVLEIDGKPASAILQYEKALELRSNYAVVLHNLAKLRFYGPEELRNFETARKYFSRAAELGYDASMPVIGTMSRDALGGERNYAAAAQWFQIAAEKGNPFSQNALAECYENGWGLQKDLSQALLWYRSSAELDYMPAFRNLGRIFAEGIGVTANDRRAFDWYSRAAERGDVESQYHVGAAFLSGKGVVQSNDYALEWLTKAAEQGHAKAMRDIANLYYNKGEKTDELGLAAAWYKKAAAKGDSISQFQIANMFEKGMGVDRDKDQAINYFREAARQGHSESQKRLIKLKADW